MVHGTSNHMFVSMPTLFIFETGHMSRGATTHVKHLKVHILRMKCSNCECSQCFHLFPAPALKCLIAVSAGCWLLSCHSIFVCNVHCVCCQVVRSQQCCVWLKGKEATHTLWILIVFTQHYRDGFLGALLRLCPEPNNWLHSIYGIPIMCFRSL